MDILYLLLSLIAFKKLPQENQDTIFNKIFKLYLKRLEENLKKNSKNEIFKFKKMKVFFLSYRAINAKYFSDVWPQSAITKQKLKAI